MSDFSDTRNITGQDIESGVFWKPQRPEWNLPKIGKTPMPAAPQKQQLSKDYSQAAEFVSILKSQGPQAAYARFGAGDINSLFDAAVGYGLLNEGERESIWATFNQPEPTTTGTASNTVSGGMGILGSALAPREVAPVTGGTMTTEMIVKAGGPMNAYDNAWAAGNMVEPKQEHFRTLKDYKEYYAKWRAATH